MVKNFEHTGFDWRLFLRLYRLTHPHAAQRRVVLACTFIRAFQRPLLFWALAAVINGAVASGRYPSVILGALGYLALALSTSVVAHFRQRQQNTLGENLVHDLRDQIFTNLQRQPLGYFHKTKLGRILSRVVSDLESVRRGVQLVVFIAQEFLQLAICGALMAWYSWPLFLVIVGFAPVLLWANRHFHPRIHRFSRAAAESSSRLTGSLAESVRGIRVIQGYTRQGRGAEAFGAHVNRLSDDNVRLATESALYAPLLGLTGQFFLAALLIVGGYGALHGFAHLDIESLVAFFFLPTSFFMSVQAAPPATTPASSPPKSAPNASSNSSTSCPNGRTPPKPPTSPIPDSARPTLHRSPPSPSSLASSTRLGLTLSPYSVSISSI